MQVEQETIVFPLSYHMDSSLYNAALAGNIDALRQNEDKIGVQVTPTNNTVLHLASQLGKTEAVEAILSIHPPLLIRQNSRGETALHLAARCGHIGVVRALIRHARAVDVEEIESGVEHGKFMWKMNCDNDTAFHEAVRYKQLEVVSMLIKEDPTYSYSGNKAGETPLYLAASRGFHKLVSVILKKCESPAYGGPEGRTALHGAITKDSQECTKELLEWKKDLITETDLYGHTPLHYASIIGYKDRVRQLLLTDEYTAYLADKDKNTAIHMAASRGHVSIMEEVISHCPDCCDMVNDKGRNILHIAVEHEKKKVIEYILKHCLVIGSLIIQKDVDGNTPIHLLATSYCIVPELMQHPMADREALNNEGLTPLDMEYGNKWLWQKKEIAKIRRRHGSTFCLKKAISMDKKTFTTKETPTAPVTKETFTAPVEEVINGRMNKVVNTHIIVAALIVAVTFAAGFTVPGGYSQEQGPNIGMAELTRKAAFKAFMIADTIALVFSTSSLLIYIIAPDYDAADYKHKWALINSFIKFMWLGGNLICLALVAMMLAFITGTYAVLAHCLPLAIGTSVIGCFGLIVYFLVLIKYFRDLLAREGLKFNCSGLMRFYMLLVENVIDIEEMYTSL